MLWDLLGTKVLFTSAYYLQMDGQVECAYCTIEQVIQFPLEELGVGHNKCIEFLPFVDFAIKYIKKQ